MPHQQIHVTPSDKHSRLKIIVIGCGAALAIFAVTCCLLSAGSALVYKTVYPPLPSESEALMALVEGQVAQIRGLEFQTPVAFTLLTSDELRQNIEQDFAEEWSEDEAADAVITLAAFDLIDSNFDLYNLYLDLFTEQIAGYYDPEEQTMYVISNGDAINVSQRLTLAHELTHALQDQHFHLDKLTDEDSDDEDTEADFAFRALVEGEASLVEQHYLAKLAPHEYPLLVQEALAINTDVLDRTPHAIAESQLFPYREGLAFANDLFQQGGWPALNAAHQNPPVSTEQIIHPDRYRTGDTPQVVSLPPLTDTLGSGWRLVDDDNVGEFFLRLHLSHHLSPTLVSEAATGWGGDWYAVYHNDDEKTPVLVMRTLWDTPSDSAEFFEAYTLYLERAAGTATDSSAGDLHCWRLDGESRCLVFTNNEVLVIRAPNEAMIERIRQTVHPK